MYMDKTNVGHRHGIRVCIYIYTYDMCIYIIIERERTWEFPKNAGSPASNRIRPLSIETHDFGDSLFYETDLYTHYWQHVHPALLKPRTIQIILPLERKPWGTASDTPVFV